MALRSIKRMAFALLVGCAAAGPSTRANAAEPIRVGAVLPFSGGVELYGQQAKLGLDLAVKDINAAGGILGRPLQVIYADDKTRPASAVTAAQGLIQNDGVVALVGPVTSQNFNAIVPVAESSCVMLSGNSPSKTAMAYCAACSCAASGACCACRLPN